MIDVRFTEVSKGYIVNIPCVVGEIPPSYWRLGKLECVFGTWQFDPSPGVTFGLEVIEKITTKMKELNNGT